MPQKIIILGCGKIGTTLIQQMLDKDPEKNFCIVGLVDIGTFLFNPQGIDQKILTDIINNHNINQYGEKIKEINEVFAKTKNFKEQLFFVDATAGKDELKDFHLKIIEDTKHCLVTANKNPVSLYDHDIYRRLTKTIRYQFTTTVMAGAGIVRFLRRLEAIYDDIQAIEGVFSGTLGFICGELDKNRPISEVVKEAYDQGYTEPHPWNDLNGLDVARKLTILARCAGFKVNVEDIEINPLLPDYLGQEKNIPQFLKNLEKENKNIQNKVQKAQKNGNVLRYLASLKYEKQNLKLSVGLKEVPVQSSFGVLKGPANLVQIITKCYPASSPYILQSPGAGLEVTAASLRKDLLVLFQSNLH